MTRAGLVMVVAIVCATATMTAQEKREGMALRPVAQTPAWKQLSTLVGQWTGVIEDGTQTPATASVRMTGDGSAIMHVLGPDTPIEMVTMFHQDHARVLATHYCAAHNQPRMALVPSASPNQLTFDFVDGTNIGPGEVHMARLTITFTDADHHEEAWTSRTNGQDGPAMVFRFTRRK